METTPYPSADYLRKLAQQAGEIMKKNFILGMKKEMKSDNTPLTEADTAINSLVVGTLLSDFPHIRVIGEEESRDVHDAEYYVLCDPVDGTIPFSLGVPVSAFCIAVVREQTPLVSVIYDPFSDRLWHAVRGGGSFLNGKPARVSQRGIHDSNICMVWWRNSPYHLHDVCKKLMDVGAQWMNPVSIAYFGGLVASGEFEATIFPGRNGWETAAMHAIVEEAGGKVTDIHGDKMRYGPNGEVEGHIISNGVIHEKLVRIVQECQEK